MEGVRRIHFRQKLANGFEIKPFVVCVVLLVLRTCAFGGLCCALRYTPLGKLNAHLFNKTKDHSIMSKLVE